MSDWLAEVKNLQVIVLALERHNASCPFPATGIAMSPFEIERLGWDQIKGVPLVPDDKLGTGMFRIVCNGNTPPPLEAEVETGEVVHA